MRSHDSEEHIFDPYATDDPNVGEVRYGTPGAPDKPGADGAQNKPGADGTPDKPGVSRVPGTPARGADGEPDASRFGEVRYGSPDEFHDARRPSADEAERPRIPEKRRVEPRKKQAVSVRLDGEADEGDGDRRDAIGELRETGGRAITKKQLKRRVQSKSRRAKRKPNAAVLIVVLAYVLVVGACVTYVAVGRQRAGNASVETEPEVVVTASVAASEQSAVPDGFTSVDVPTDSLHAGDLILVNYAYPYVFPEQSDTVSVYDYKTRSYKVRDTLVSLSKRVVERFNTLTDDFAAATGCADLMVVSGFRDYDFQNEIWVDRVQTEGEEEAAKYVAVPGYSEHHTALALDLSVYLADGRTVYVEDYEPCDWFEEHAPEYGFVLRYPSVKAATTHISYESWHYRFVGVPHGEIMYEKDFCLEEYVDFLRSFKCGERYLGFKKGSSFESEAFPSDADYVIYYVPRFDGETTSIPVPDGAKYELSGNNVDGFIVTVDRKG